MGYQEGGGWLKKAGIAVLVGILIGTVESLFLISSNYLIAVRETHSFLLGLIPLAGLLMGFLYHKFGDERVFRGNNLVINCLNQDRPDPAAEIPAKMSLLVYANAITTLFVGGSVGRMGAGVQGAASVTATALRLVARFKKAAVLDAEMILRAAMSAAFSAVLGVPLTGVWFGMEFTSPGRVKYRYLPTCLIASSISFFVTLQFGLNRFPYFQGDTLPFHGMTLLNAVALSAAAGVVSRVFYELLYRTKALYNKIFSNSILKGGIGGMILLAAILAVGMNYKYSGIGTVALNQAMEGPALPYEFILKMGLTVLTVAAGLTGGEIMPFLVTGGLFGSGLSSFLGLPPFLGGIIGASAVLSGALNLPIVCFLLSFELFGGQNFVYIFIACAVGYFVSGKSGIYTAQVTDRR